MSSLTKTREVYRKRDLLIAGKRGYHSPYPNDARDLWLNSKGQRVELPSWSSSFRYAMMLLCETGYAVKPNNNEWYVLDLAIPGHDWFTIIARDNELAFAITDAWLHWEALGK